MRHLARGLVCLAALTLCRASAAREVFTSPAAWPHRFPLWRVTNRPESRSDINYHNTGCWSPDGRYLCLWEMAPGSTKIGYRTDVSVYDTHKDATLKLGRGLYPRWANKRNWLFYIESGKGARYYGGRSVWWVDMDTGKRRRLLANFPMKLLGETDSEDRWLYGNRLVPGGKRGAMDTVRIPIRENSEAQVLAGVGGRRPLPNPRHPVVIQRYRTTKYHGPLLANVPCNRILYDLDGKNVRAACLLNRGIHVAWLGDGEWFLMGNGPISGRRWDEPFGKGDVHFLANGDCGDPSPCEGNGRFMVAEGLVDLRSGECHPRIPMYSRHIWLAAEIDGSDAADSDPKGSPDATKIAFKSVFDLKDGPITRLTRVYYSGRDPAIRVVSTAGFPAEGHVVINKRNVVRYGRKTATTFEDLAPGRFGTAAINGDPSRPSKMLVSLLTKHLLTQAERDRQGKPNPICSRYVKDPKSPLLWQRQTDVYVAVVRKPDAPALLARGGLVLVIPGENHRETRGYRILRDGKPVADKLLTTGEKLKLTRPGLYQAQAVEFSGLESEPGLSVRTRGAAQALVAAGAPKGFAWTREVWLSDGKSTHPHEAMKRPMARKEIHHLNDGLIHVEIYRYGRRLERSDLGAKKQLVRRTRYDLNGTLRTREYYAQGELRFIERFGDDGWKESDEDWRYGNKWWYRRGIPLKADTWRGVYLLRDGKWILAERGRRGKLWNKPPEAGD